MERETPDGEFVYVRVETERGLLSMHAETLVLGEDGDDTLYGEIVASKDETRSEGKMFEVRIENADNDPELRPFFDSE